MRKSYTNRARSYRSWFEKRLDEEKAPEKLLEIEAKLRFIFKDIESGVDEDALHDLQSEFRSMEERGIGTRFDYIADSIKKLFDRIDAAMKGEEYGQSAEGFDVESGGVDWAWKRLGIDPDADEATIKATWKKLALKYHPDSNSGFSDLEKMKKVNEAYDFLKRYLRFKF